MPDFALNHMTVASRSFSSLLDIASALDCIGIEVRNDLGALFGGESPAVAGQAARERQLRILALAEVREFNRFTENTHQQCRQLMETAVASGAEAISLIPCNDGAGLEKQVRMRDLQHALQELKPLLASYGLVGLVEPLGFATCALRDKSEVIEVIESLDASAHFKLVHDTFHHQLAGGGPLFPEHTGIVHISGVVDAALNLSDMRDEHRVLVDEHDRLDNLGQLAALYAGGYHGPVSFEAFSPAIHTCIDPVAALAGSMNHIVGNLSVSAA